MIDAKQAVRIAREHVREMFKDDVASQPDGGDFRLEELEHAENDDWHVTISFLRRVPAPPVVTFAPTPAGALAEALSNVRIVGVDASREYKLVTVSPGGDVRSVRLRPITVSR